MVKTNPDMVKKAKASQPKEKKTIQQIIDKLQSLGVNAELCKRVNLQP
ncbi:hypothetical protein [Fredinandcohnia quinoae]|uniref:Uncharacterized protein n=1 Tax=Fredinandcohnia quinoae TaxID=2918902 RepID=A0AAW5E088_9BACI|nr:hypothetical protein [Fredinandcohnia sp. SECRCQ15]MCH1625723.1 hypothetical protein [Fredinandcohnia sp. SECRCQ15]